MNPTEATHLDKRRTVCKACISGMTVCSLAAVGFPVVTFLGFPIRPAAERPIEVPLERLAAGQAVYVSRRGKQIIILSQEQGPLAVNAACTHLGCNVTWDAAASVFRCPCHGAEFDARGEVISGPVNAPLQQVPFTMEDGKIILA